MTTPRKRSRKSTPESMSSSRQVSEDTLVNLPPIPPIYGDVILETFTHKSLRFGGSYDNSQLNDNERLSELGRSVLNLVATNSVYHRQNPTFKASDFADETEKLLKLSRINEWVDYYNLRSRIRFLPSDVDINSLEEGHELFCAYVGGVFVQSGMGVVLEWLSVLIDPDNIPPISDGHFTRAQLTADTQAPAPKRHRATHNENPQASSADIPPPPLPAGPARAAAVNTGDSFLKRFNTSCSQKHVKVEYVADNEGLPHAPNWVTECLGARVVLAFLTGEPDDLLLIAFVLVDGILKGRGSGPSKQVSKEAAAREAYHAMGWANVGL